MSEGDGPEPSRTAKKRAGLQSRVGLHRSDISAGVREARERLDEARERFDEAQERINARSGRNLLFASIFGVALGVAMLASLLVMKEFFLVVAGVLVGFALTALAGALRFAGRDVPRVASVVAGIAVLPIAYWVPEGQWFGLLGALVFVSLWRLVEVAVRRPRPAARDVWLDLGAGALLQLYVTLLGSCAVVLTARDNGQWWTISFLIVVIVTDIGAYVSGLNFGKHPMAPRISPKKTWEGFAGSMVAAVAAGILLSVLLLDEPWYFGVLFGLVLAGTATIGDLTESLIKRDLGIKDISSWLPGHGGFMDRLDSILPSAVGAYALYALFS